MKIWLYYSLFLLASVSAIVWIIGYLLAHQERLDEESRRRDRN